MAIMGESRFKYGLAIISGGLAAMLALLTFIPMAVAAKIVLLSIAGANIALSGYVTTIAIKQDRYEKKKAAKGAAENVHNLEEAKANAKGKSAEQSTVVTAKKPTVQKPAAEEVEQERE